MSCRKRRFRDRIAAELFIAKIHNRGTAKARDLRRAYQCPKCDGWHLTSQPRRRRMAESWWVLSGTALRDMLNRASGGEPPDTVMAEYYANSDHEETP